MPSDRRLHSQKLRGLNVQGNALRMGMNWTEEDLGKPQILVDSAYGMGHPGTFQFRPLIEKISNGGGGDSFAAGLIFALLEQRPPAAALRFALAAGVLKHTIPGDFNRVSLAEIERVAAGDDGARLQR
jgi:hypothetical protein